MEGIQVSVEKTGAQDRISIIRVGGYIDTTTSSELEHSMDSLLKAGSYNIVVDLGNVDYISSAGWGIFISEIKGIREKGGDLKLARMIPDVYEVFELLEFHYILKAFDTLEEAINDFDLKESKAEEVLTEETEEVPKKVVKEKVTVSTPSKRIEDKVKQIIIENPDIGIFKIKSELNTERFGFTKIGLFSLRKRLKEMNLDTKKRRVDFFKEHSFKK